MLHNTPSNNQTNNREVKKPKRQKASFQKYLRRREVAARYAVAPITVDRWTLQKRLPAPVMIGRTVRWILEELEAFDAKLSGERE